ncbi:MAG: Hsp20 family protein [Acidimicrobiia bacterium]|nr:Hsp20 family protein [Acidimicrobiia bacterium]
MVLRFDPFRELDRLASVAFEGSGQVTVPMDVVRSANEVRVSFDLPGVDPGTVDLTVERNRLTLQATRRSDLAEGESLVVRERPSGDFSRTLRLSEGLDPSRVTAEFRHGVLTVTIPVAEMAQARKISIATGPSRPQVIEAGEGGESGDGEEAPANGAAAHVSG